MQEVVRVEGYHTAFTYIASIKKVFLVYIKKGFHRVRELVRVEVT